MPLGVEKMRGLYEALGEMRMSSAASRLWAQHERYSGARAWGGWAGDWGGRGQSAPHLGNNDVDQSLPCAAARAKANRGERWGEFRLDRRSVEQHDLLPRVRYIEYSTHTVQYTIHTIHHHTPKPS